MAIEFGQILCDMPLDVPQPPAIYHHYEDRVQVASPLRWWTANASGATLACILARSTSAAHRRATASGSPKRVPAADVRLMLELYGAVYRG